MSDELTVRILSQRGVRPTVARCMGFEFEDRAARLLGAEVVVPVHRRTSAVRERLVKGVARRVSPAARVGPGYTTHPGDGVVDVTIVHCQFPADVLLLHALPAWRKRTGRAIAYIEELWSASMGRWGGLLDLFADFDQVYVGISGSAERLARCIDTPVDYLPYSVDTTRFAPVDVDAPRPIDALTVGRRSPVTHAALLDWSVRENRFYHFDSYTAQKCHDLAEHRIMYSRLHQQSAFSISNRGVGAATAGSDGEEALPARYFETAAAGGVLVGKRPSNPEFADEFGWEDSVIDAPFDDPEMPERLEALSSEPERLNSIRHRNVSEVLRRHDTSHRLSRMLTDVGIDVPKDLLAAIDDRRRAAAAIGPVS